MFEGASAKRNILWDLQNQEGYFVYQFTQLRMLELYYDFQDKFIDREDFEHLQMHTDSLYVALSRRS